MKRSNTELDVDIIGGQGPLTKSEEQAISKFLRERKTKQSRKHVAPKRSGQTITPRRKAVV